MDGFYAQVIKELVCASPDLLSDLECHSIKPLYPVSISRSYKGIYWKILKLYMQLCRLLGNYKYILVFQYILLCFVMNCLQQFLLAGERREGGQMELNVE